MGSLMSLFCHSHAEKATLTFCFGFILFKRYQIQKQRATAKFFDTFRAWHASEEIPEDVRFWKRQLFQKVVTSLENAPERDMKIDVSVAGGGMKNGYSIGVALALNQCLIEIDRGAGASFGASTAAILTKNILSPEEIRDEPFWHFSTILHNVLLEFGIIDFYAISEVIVGDFTLRLYAPDKNKLFVSYTTLDMYGFHEKVVKYDGSQDLMMLFNVSSALPFINTPHQWPYMEYKGEIAMDGGFTNNSPVSCLIDEERKDILKIDCNKCKDSALGYFLHVVTAPKEATEKYVLQGIEDTFHLLRNEMDEYQGLKLIRSESAFMRKTHSYQLLPGIEHLRRFFLAEKIIP